MRKLRLETSIPFSSFPSASLMEKMPKRTLCRISGALLILLLGFLGTSQAQNLSGSFPSGGGAISVTANGGDVHAAGLDFLSKSNGLIPAPGTDASPFTFFLSNTRNQVTYGNLGSNVTFANGSTTALSVGATADTSDITAAWGAGAVPIPFDVREDRRNASVGLTEDFRFVLRGTDLQVDGLTLTSSGSIIPAADPSPFQSLLNNDQFKVEYSGGPVSLEGELLLTSSWDRNVGLRDVAYQFTNAPFSRINADEYPSRAPIRNIEVNIDADNKFVLSGNGNELREVRFDSRSRSLTPATSFAPFTGFGLNDASRIDFVSSTFVTLDGDLKLTAGYNPQVAGEDVRVAIKEVGDRFAASRLISNYPEPTPRVQLVLDGDDRFVLRGDGEQLMGIEFQSPSGGLKLNESEELFPITLSNKTTQLTYGVLGAENAVSLDGEIRLASGWTPGTAADVEYSYGVGGALVGPFPLFKDPGVVPEAVGVALNENTRWVLNGAGQKLRDFRLHSVGGGLVPATSPAPFTSLGTNTQNYIDFESNGAVSLDGSLTLQAGWDFDSGHRDVGYDYLEEGVATRKSFSVPASVYPVPPPQSRLSVDIDRNDYRFVVSGRGHRLRDLQFGSESGSIDPADSAMPFESMTENTPNRVTLSAGDAPVTIDGSLKLSAGWNASRSKDVDYSYDQVGIAGRRGPFDIASSTYPALSPLAVRLDSDFRFELSGTGARLDQFEVNSSAGSLVPAESPGPFASLTENTNNRVVFSTSENAPVVIDGDLKLSAGVRPFGLKDVSYQYKRSNIDGTFGPFDLSEYPATPPATLGLNDDNRFVMRGQGQVVDSLTITSNGSLVPAETPAPFTGLGENTDSIVQLSGGPITIDGDLTLTTGWDSNVGIRNVAYEFSGQQRLTLKQDEYPPRAPVRNITTSINADDKFVLNGSGNQLRRVTLQSPSRSIVPGESPAPFTSYNSNSSRVVDLASSSFVTLDGDLTLTAGYNRQVGGKDVTVRIQEVGDVFAGISNRIQSYPDTLPPIQVGLDRDNRFVLTGQGEELLGFEFESESGSLVLGNTNEPFQITLQNTPNRLTYGVLGTENAVTIDGSVTLSSGWNPLGSPDVEYSYGLIGGALIGPTDLFKEPPAQLDVVRVSLDDRFRWVLNGKGERLEQFDLFSERGGLIPAELPGPFQSLTLNDENSIRFETDGIVSVDGSVALAAGWSFDLGIRDVRYWYREEGNELNAGPYVVPTSVYPSPPASGKVGVSIDDNDHKFVLEGEGHLLRTFALNSPSGSLLPAETSEPFVSLSENTKTRVAYEMPTHVELDGTLKLNSGYDIDVAGEDVSYRYQQLGHASLRGPFDVSQREYPPNPRKSPLRVSIDDDLNFVVSGIGQPVTNLSFDSAGGSLDSAENPAPFDEFAVDTPEQVALSSLGLVRIDGSLVLPVKWTEEVADIEFVYSLEGSNEEFGPTRLRGSDYPAPNVINVAVSQTGGSIAFFGNGQLITGFEVRSEDGALDHRPVGGDYSPFDIASELTPNYGKFTSEDPIAADWIRIPFLKWDADSAPDLEFTFIGPTGSTRAVVTRIDFVAPVVPEPSGFALVGVAALCAVCVMRKSSRKVSVAN